MKVSTRAGIYVAAAIGLIGGGLWFRVVTTRHPATSAVSLKAGSTKPTAPPLVAIGQPRAIRTVPVVRLADATNTPPDTVLPILSRSSLPIRQRIQAARAIQRSLTREEIAAFFQYLVMPSLSGEPINENWLRNELLDKLVSQEQLPPQLPQLLDAIYQDRMQDDVTRDYAIQHMTPIFERIGPEEKDLLRQDLWQAVQEAGTSIGGTALLALEQLSHTDPQLDREQVAETALKMVNDAGCGELSRITAVQICARVGLKKAEPVVAALVTDATQPAPLRIAAIAALGDLGSPQRKSVLQQIASGKEPRLIRAAKSALGRLNDPI